FHIVQFDRKLDTNTNKLRLELNIEIMTYCLASLQVSQEQRSAMLLPYKNLAPPLSLRPIHHPNNISNFDVSSAFMWSMRSKMTSDPFKRHRYLIRPSQCQQ